jgi:hypothetical protein
MVIIRCIKIVVEYYCTSVNEYAIPNYTRVYALIYWCTFVLLGGSSYLSYAAVFKILKLKKKGGEF